MQNDDQQAALRAVGILLNPLVRLLIRLNIPFRSFAEVAKQAYVRAAEEGFQLQGRKQTHSRIAVLTGLTRKEVARVRELPAQNDRALSERFNRCSRVISGWLRDEMFSSLGKPKALPFEGEEPCFKTLVQRYSGDMPPRAMLDELFRIGALIRRPNGRLALNKAAFVPTSNIADKLAMLGRDAADLIDTIDHNLEAPSTDSRFQLRVEYDNLSRESAQAFQALSDRQSMALLRQYDEWLAKHDRDTDSEPNGDGRFRVGVGLYYFQQDLSAQTEEEKEL
ncbi:DUF6502 family protein [Motiliproteus sp. SC1-56]|uniref:DUF6502 family protein n=1 Tax=Motiliproteus sp. SC1-56 TaxID=2799565 RepID=UPI001A8F9798|nr:DUF6502 family protein [Motiliproteus sp. SC1-56]